MNLRLTLLTTSLTGLLVGAAPGQDAVPLSDVAHIHGVAFDPADPEHLLLATHFGVYRTMAGGVARPRSTDANDYMGFTTHPTDPSVLLASGHPAQGGNMGFIISKDGGTTWTQISLGASGPVDFHAMTVSRADPKTIYGLYEGIQASLDAGATWFAVGTGPGVVIDLAASAISPQTLYAGTMQGLAVSKDGGATWQHSGETMPVTMVETAPDGTLYAFYAQLGLFRADPEGKNWTAVAADFGSHDLLHMAVDPTKSDHLVAVTQDSLILESDDGGKTWTDLSL